MVVLTRILWKCHEILRVEVDEREREGQCLIIGLGWESFCLFGLELVFVKSEIALWEWMNCQSVTLCEIPHLSFRIWLSISETTAPIVPISKYILLFLLLVALHFSLFTWINLLSFINCNIFFPFFLFVFNCLLAKFHYFFSMKQ